LPWELDESANENSDKIKIFKTPKDEWPVNTDKQNKYHVMFYYLPNFAKSDDGTLDMTEPDVVKWKVTKNKVCFVPWLVLTPKGFEFPTEKPKSPVINIIDATDKLAPLSLEKYELDSSGKIKSKISITDDEKRKRILKKMTDLCHKKIKNMWNDKDKTAYEVQGDLEKECGLSRSSVDRLHLGSKLHSIGGSLTGGVSNIFGSVFAKKVFAQVKLHVMRNHKELFENKHK